MTTYNADELGWAGSRKVQHIVPPPEGDTLLPWPALCGKAFNYDEVSYYHRPADSGTWSHCPKCVKIAKAAGIDPADIGEPL